MTTLRLSAAQYNFTLFKREMTAHLNDWETDIVPVMRRRFTQQEERKVRLEPGRHTLSLHSRQKPLGVLPAG